MALTLKLAVLVAVTTHVTGPSVFVVKVTAVYVYVPAATPVVVKDTAPEHTIL